MFIRTIEINKRFMYMNSNVQQKILDRHIEKPNLERKNRGVLLTNPFIFRPFFVVSFSGRGQKKWAMVSFVEIFGDFWSDCYGRGQKKWAFWSVFGHFGQFWKTKVGREIGLKSAKMGLFWAKMGVFGAFLGIFRHFLMKFRVCGQKPTFILYLI